ncbi:MAG TPA: hypothetical protein P5256_12085, partial [Beijerinckiaceae bacterium]|nr:hypothetical protein [Beijerinckiaceae bacterium]
MTRERFQKSVGGQLIPVEGIERSRREILVVEVLDRIDQRAFSRPGDQVVLVEGDTRGARIRLRDDANRREHGHDRGNPGIRRDIALCVGVCEGRVDHVFGAAEIWVVSCDCGHQRAGCLRGLEADADDCIGHYGYGVGLGGQSLKDRWSEICLDQGCGGLKYGVGEAASSFDLAGDEICVGLPKLVRKGVQRLGTDFEYRHGGSGRSERSGGVGFDQAPDFGENVVG